jgi:hypothetical protein
MKRIFFMLCIAAGLAACGDGSDNATRTDSTTNDKEGSMYRNDSTKLNDTSQRVPDPTQPRDTSSKKQ